MEAAELLRVARAEIAAGSALLPAAAASELILGERTSTGVQELASVLDRVPTVILSTEAARHAGGMGAFLAGRGAPVPFGDLLIAATAVWLEVPLLTWDADYARARQEALRFRGVHPGADLWRSLQLHPASRSL